MFCAQTKPRPGTCAEINVVLEWDNFEGHRNVNLGGEGYRVDSGGERIEYGLNLFFDNVCESTQNALWFLDQASC